MTQLCLPGNAKAPQVLEGVGFSAGAIYNGKGTMRNNGAVDITPAAFVHRIEEGYHNGLGGVKAVTVPADKVLAGTTIAGTAGTVPVITSAADPAQGVGLWADNGLAVYPEEGYRKGGVGAGEIKVSLNQLHSVGLVRFSTGSFTASGSNYSRNLGFRPRVVVVEYSNNGSFRAVYISNGHLGNNKFAYYSYGGSSVPSNTVVWTITDTGFTLTVNEPSGMGNAQFWAFS